MKVSRCIGTIVLGIIMTLMLFNGCLCRDKNRYYDDMKGFSLLIPGEWEKAASGGGADLILLPPVEQSLIAFRPNMTVVVRDRNETFLLAEYQARTLEEIKSVLSEFRLMESGEDKIAGETGGVLHFSYILGSVNIEVLQYTVLHKKKSFSITFSAMPAEFLRFKEIAEKTVKSFELL